MIKPLVIVAILLAGVAAFAQPATTRPAVEVPPGAELVEPKADDTKYMPEGEAMRQSTATYEGEGGSLDYLVAVPADYDADAEKAWPLVIFLHGSGERGDEVELVAAWGPPKLAKAGAAIPAIVVSPQCPAGSWWPREIEALDGLLGQVESNYRVDADRIYLTGLSLGGFGSVAWAAAEPERFAAVAPICGGGNPEQAKAMAAVPTWFFHGTEDTAVPYMNSVELYNAMRQADADHVKLTLYDGVDHFSWIPAYADPRLWEWMFSQRRPTPAPR